MLHSRSLPARLAIGGVAVALSASLVAACASAPLVPPKLGSAALFVTNTLEVPAWATRSGWSSRRTR